MHDFALTLAGRAHLDVTFTNKDGGARARNAEMQINRIPSEILESCRQGDCYEAGPGPISTLLNAGH